MCPTLREGRKNCFIQFCAFRQPHFYKQRHIHQIFDPTVSSLALAGVGVKFFGKLLFPRNSGAGNRGNTYKPQPVSSRNNFSRPDKRIADSYIKMEFCENATGNE